MGFTMLIDSPLKSSKFHRLSTSLVSNLKFDIFFQRFTERFIVCKYINIIAMSPRSMSNADTANDNEVLSQISSLIKLSIPFIFPACVSLAALPAGM